ncbi:MAG: hypothetical protein ACRC56_11300 [Bosea sp. (in: a-proteobacteria)]
MRMVVLSVVALAAFAAGCRTATPVASYDWKWERLRADATDEEQAFKTCNGAATRATRLQPNAMLQITRHATGLMSCMRQQGWRSVGQPVKVRYVE